jgi:membrane protease subunit HflK
MSPESATPEPPNPFSEPSKTPLDAGSRALEEALRSSFRIIQVVMVILLALFFCSGITTVGPQEKAVILRFGRPLSTGPENLLGPGFHWAFPYPIDEVKKIPVGQIQSVTSTVGWYAITDAQAAAGIEPPPNPFLNPAADGYVITADGNIVHARARLSYHITDALAYTFNFTNAQSVVINVLNHALVYAAAHSTVDDALVNNAGFKEKVLGRVNKQIEELKLGITLEPSEVTVIAPRFVKPDFDAVLNAQQDSSKTVLTAQGNAQSISRQAEAEANALVSGAEAQRSRYVAAVQADAAAFSAQLPQYEANPELFKQRRLTETWQRILSVSPDKFFLPEPMDGKVPELRLLLNREAVKPKE